MFIALAVLMVTSSAIAQINTPASSPLSKVEQKVGLTTVSLEYSRPNVKGRTLFVDVEAFGSIWRTGANGATKITFSDDVKLEGNTVPAGTYALYSIPDPNEWTIMLYKDLTLGGNVSKYDRGKELLRFKVRGYTKKSTTESFTIEIGDLEKDGATISLKWGNYYVPMKLAVSYEKEVQKQIDAIMGGPSRGEYYTAAKYYLDNDKELEQAYEWIKMANSKDEKYWQMRVQAQIEAKLGKSKLAKKSIQRSSALARGAGNNGYAKGNDAILAGF